MAGLSAQIPTAAADTPPMSISASGGDGTHVVTDGTQGAESNSVQGVQDSDGDQDARDMTKSPEAVPQVLSPNKMTK